MKRRRRPKLKRLKRAFWSAAILVLAVHFTLPALTRTLRRTDVRVGLALIALTLLSYGVRRVRRWRSVRARLRASAVSDRRRDYVIEAGDFARATAKESAYRRTMQLNLLATFGNACARCGARDDGLDLDHFFIPKSAGGCFIMRHAEGYLVNNAIPLCMHCNRAKSDRPYRTFFRSEQLAVILEKNARLTRLLNERPPLDDHGHVRARARRPAA